MFSVLLVLAVTEMYDWFREESVWNVFNKATLGNLYGEWNNVKSTRLITKLCLIYNETVSTVTKTRCMHNINIRPCTFCMQLYGYS